MKNKKTAVEWLTHLDSSFLGKLILLPLVPLSYLFCILVTIRARLYKWGIIKADELKCRVLCIGNITSGGTGKTPMVKLLAGKLASQGIAVAIVSRGYKGGSENKTQLVSNYKQILKTAAEVGDEPYLLARQLPGIPVVVSKIRYRAGMYTYLKFKPQIIIMDDGYQHLKMRRQVNIMVIDATNPFGNGYLLPRGTLREPLRALERANIFLINKTDLVEDIAPITAKLKKYNSTAAILTGKYQPINLTKLGDDDSYSLEWLRGRKMVCFCGIGNPDSFFSLLEKLGTDIAERIKFPDHYYYSAEDLKKIEDRVIYHRAEALITTAKDAVRIIDNIPDSIPLLVLNIELRISAEQDDADKAWKLIVGDI